MKRRGNREGSIYLRPDGRWCGAIRIFNRGRCYVYGKTREEAAKKLRALLNADDLGESVVITRQKYSAFLKEWLVYIKARVRPNTYKFYSDTIELHITPPIGQERLTALTPYHIEKALTSARDKKLSPRTISYIRQVMFMSLKKAVEWERVRRNVAAGVSGPKRIKPDVHPFTVDEHAAFMNAIKAHQYHALFLVAIALGLRKGELLGLKWSDLEGDVLHVRRTLQHGLEYPPKTQSSIRDIQMPKAVAEALKAWRIIQLEMHMKAGDRWQGDVHGYVYTTSIGTSIDQRNLSRWYAGVLKAAKIPHHRFHDLRHTCATHLLRAGARVEDVSKLLGHASKSITMDIYCHSLGDGSEVAAIMDRIIG